MRRWGEGYGTSKSIPGAVPFLAFPQQQIPLEELSNAISLPVADSNPLFYVIVYALIGACTSIIFLVTTIIQFDGAIRASRELFKRVLVPVVRAATHWHVRTFYHLCVKHAQYYRVGRYPKRLVSLPPALITRTDPFSRVDSQSFR